MTKYVYLHIVVLLAFVFIIAGCRDKAERPAAPVEDAKAKAMLEGVWIDADEESVVFRIKGDTVYYPDSTSQPVAFKIIRDTMILSGGNGVSRYPIVKQGSYVFEFKNQNNDIVRLVKSDDPNDSLYFVRRPVVTLNQKKIIKRDSVVTFDDRQYHCYVQVNPTTYKVFRTYYNSEGIEIDNIYYDNIIHISIFAGADRLFSKDFRKSDFGNFVPKNMLKQCILSDIKLSGLDGKGFRYQVQLAIPDSPSSFILNMTITYDGKVNMKVSNPAGA